MNSPFNVHKTAASDYKYNVPKLTNICYDLCHAHIHVHILYWGDTRWWRSVRQV